MLCLGRVCPTSGVARREAGAMPQTLNKWNFYVSMIYKKYQFCCQQMCFFKLKMHQNRFRPGLRPGPRWGSLRRSPRPPSRLGRGKPPPHSPPSRRLRRVDPCPPNEKIVPAPLNGALDQMPCGCQAKKHRLSCLYQ